MRKTYPLTVDGKHPDRVMDAIKHDIRKYLRRERRRPLPEGVDFLDFDCRFGADADQAENADVSALIGLLDTAARDGASQAYIEILAKPGHKAPRPTDGDEAPEEEVEPTSDDNDPPAQTGAAAD